MRILALAIKPEPMEPTVWGKIYIKGVIAPNKKPLIFI